MKLSKSYTHLVLAKGGARVSLSSEVARKSGERRKEEMELLFHEVLIGYQC
jgi:hypothetical protein